MLQHFRFSGFLAALHALAFNYQQSECEHFFKRISDEECMPEDIHSGETLYFTSAIHFWTTINFPTQTKP